MNRAVDQPILNSPFEEPARYWIYEWESGKPLVMEGCRPAGYYFRARRRADIKKVGKGKVGKGNVCCSML